jgi:hypothetical protein
MRYAQRKMGSQFVGIERLQRAGLDMIAVSIV